MAIGTTFTHAINRQELIEAAFYDAGLTRFGDSLSLDQIKGAILKLNNIIREEDLRDVGKAKNLWALSTDHLILSANKWLYAVADGLANNIRSLESVVYRDSSGDDFPVEILSTKQYEGLVDKNETGDPFKVYLKRDRLTASNVLWLASSLTSITTGSVATGSDSNDYTALMPHTALTGNKPITGSDFTLFWKLTGSGGSAWAVDTAYVNPELLRYTYKRPLFDFVLPGDNPDMPLGWNRYLISRLAYDLVSPNSEVAVGTKRSLKAEFKDARNDLFPSTKEGQVDFHNQSQFL